jgi:aryl-alcohol dehydrogenase-like predicted oxidoreductase
MDDRAIPSRRLGPGGPEIRPLGVGAWQWGDRRYWGFDPRHGYLEAREAFLASLDAGITLIDTAEIYGRGESERIIGRALSETGREALIASKFAPLPWRLRPESLGVALDASLRRLGRASLDLYQVHWPYSLLRIEPLMEQLAEAVSAGRVRAVGVSNYSAKQMLAAHRALADRGVPLASNQVNYSLLRRRVERDGTLAACRELGVTLIAYSPLAQGALTGKYGPGRGRVSGVRRFRPWFRALPGAMPLIEALEEVGRAHERTAAQVALNWLARQESVIPIPGARNGRQAAENAAAIDFAITHEEAARLERLSRRWRK